MELETQLLSSSILSVSAADSIEICDLEYDVASVGATEPSHAEENQAAFYLVHYRLPEHK